MSSAGRTPCPLACYYRYAHGSILSMKLSVSLADEDVEFLDAYARARGIPSRSAVVQRAVKLLRAAELQQSYAGAWDEWAAEEDGSLWEATAADGIASGS